MSSLGVGTTVRSECMTIRKFRIRIERGTGPQVEMSARSESVTIGRGENAEFVIDDPGVSPVHCEIRHTPDGFVIRDLDSEQGTWISGIRVREARLPDEARIALGDAELSFV